ncbi:MAG: DUF456 domain-containing protein [Gemmatimonadota bacterium]|nr:DUF456 domain-containing protein [Gemmatimonadota bacterium]
METALLWLALIVGLILIPLGLPGLWVMAGTLLLYNVVRPGGPIGIWTIVIAAVCAVIGELLEFVLGGRFARRYGGSRRAGWGAILGSIAGTFAGVPIPIIGPMIGAFAGAFAGALVAELTRGTQVGSATRVATGALLGRVVAVAVKVGLGVGLIGWVAVVTWTSLTFGAR